jgi:hypothetical protein
MTDIHQFGRKWVVPIAWGVVQALVIVGLPAWYLVSFHLDTMAAGVVSATRMLGLDH